MSLELRKHVLAQEGGLIELRFPELAGGLAAEVTVRVSSDATPPKTLSEILGTGAGGFESADEVDAFVRRERDAWGLTAP
jgi:hypothetical protein